MSDTALQELLDTLQAAAQHCHASHVRRVASLTLGHCQKQDCGTRILWKVQSAAALRQTPAMCGRLHKGRAELLWLWQARSFCA